MKNSLLSFSKLIAAAACALTLGSCSRAEYAMLPKSSSYHGVTRAATPVPPVAAAATSAGETVAPAETAPVAATVASTTPVAQPKAATTRVTEPVAEASAIVAASPAAAPKLNLGQRLAAKAMAHKVEKLMQKAGTMRQHDNTASTARGGISGNLRLGIILILVGVLVTLLPGYIFSLLGAILAIIGIIFIVLWLLDQA